MSEVPLYGRQCRRDMGGALDPLLALAVSGLDRYREYTATEHPRPHTLGYVGVCDQEQGRLNRLFVSDSVALRDLDSVARAPHSR